MKRLGGVWAKLTGFDNLLLAYRKARRGKQHQAEVARFSQNLEYELLDLQRRLRDHTYQPGAYRLFTIYERKARLIAAAPFRDRVVHHAVMNVIEAPLDRRFIADSYACRKGKGVHVAVDRYQRWAQRYPYALKLDIRQYFPSIDHQILKTQLRHRVKDKDLLLLLDLIIDHSPIGNAEPVWFPGDDLLTPAERRRGIPIGNLTSQFFANLYLDDLDHFIKETLGAKAYLRYVDDMVLLDDDKTVLHDWREAIRAQVAFLRLRLHPRKAHIFRASHGLDLLGYRVFPQQRQLRNDNGHRFARRLRTLARAYARGDLDWEDFNPSVQSWIGHALHADTAGLRRVIFEHTLFRRGSG